MISSYKNKKIYTFYTYRTSLLDIPGLKIPQKASIILDKCNKNIIFVRLIYTSTTTFYPLWKENSYIRTFGLRHFPGFMDWAQP